MKYSLRTTMLVAGFLALGSMSPAGASWFVSHPIPGTACKPTNQFQEKYYEYREQELVNTSEEEWEIFVAACPVHEAVSRGELQEYRVVLKDAERREAWCAVYSVSGELLEQSWVESWSSGRGLVTFAPPPRGYIRVESGSFVHFSVHCLVHAGASLERIELLFRSF